MGDIVGWFIAAFFFGGIASLVASAYMFWSSYFDAHDVAPYLVGIGGILMLGFFAILIALDSVYTMGEYICEQLKKS